MSYNFPRIELNSQEQQWLGLICQQFLKGYLVDVDRLKMSWHEKGKWPKGFRPSEIDGRLLQNGNKPTLLGIWHAYPASENGWIEKFDELIRYLKERVSNKTSTEIKVDEIATAIGIPGRSVSVLIHLLASMGFYYTATVAPIRHGAVRIPGELDMYDSLRLDDPEKMEDYLSYENIEEQMKKIYGEAETEASNSSTKSASANEEDFIYANQLYDKVKGLIQDTEPLDQDTAKLIIELADDAIKEFGNTNQETKLELRKWKAQVELVLPPDTIEDLRKRAERQLLKKSYPKDVALRNALLILVIVVVVFLGFLAIRQTLLVQSDKKTTPSPTPLPLHSVEINPTATLTPPSTPTPEDTPFNLHTALVLDGAPMIVESIGFRARYVEHVEEQKRYINVYIGDVSDAVNDNGVISTFLLELSRSMNSVEVKAEKGNTFKFGMHNRLYVLEIGESGDKSVEIFLREQK